MYDFLKQSTQLMQQAAGISQIKKLMNIYWRKALTSCLMYWPNAANGWYEATRKRWSAQKVTTSNPFAWVPGLMR